MTKSVLKFFLGFFLTIIIITLKPFINIRVGKYPDRLGPFVVIPDIWINKKKLLNKKSLDLWSYSTSSLPNSFLSKMIGRKLIFVPAFIYSSLNHFFSILKLNELKKIYFLKAYTRDSKNIIDRFKPLLEFKKSEIIEAEEILKRNKIDISKKIVCINVRDSFYLNKILPNNLNYYHDRRDADINNYIKVIKYLISKNYLVVRTGKFMKEKLAFQNENFLDYPFCNFKTDLLDIYFGYKCHMVISTGSGWDGIPYVFRKPILYTNFSSHSKFQLSSYRHMSIFKLVKNNKKEYLKVNELLENDLKLITNIYQPNKTVFTNFEYIENTEDELLDATKEFEKYIKNNFNTDEEQNKYNLKFLSNFDTLKVNDVYGEPAHSMLLKGKICSSFLKKYDDILF